MFELCTGSGSEPTLKIGLDSIPLLAVLRAGGSVAFGVAGPQLRTRLIGQIMRVDVSGSSSHQCLQRVHASADVQMFSTEAYLDVVDVMSMSIVNNWASV